MPTLPANFPLGEALALLAPLSWSVAVVFFRRAGALPPLSINLFKNVLAIVLLGLTMVALGTGLPAERPAADWLRLAVSGIIGIAIADTLLFEGLRRIGAARLAIVDTAYAPVVVLLSWAFLGERPSGGFALGAALVVGGVALASLPARGGPAGPEAVGGAAANRRELALGTGMALMAIAGTACGVVIAKPVLASADLVEATWTRLVAGVAAMAVWVRVGGRGAEAAAAFRPARVWWALVPGALIGAYVSLLLWLGGYKWADASVAAVLNQLATVYMLVLARLALGERVRPRQVAGGAVAAVGALVVVLGPG